MIELRTAIDCLINERRLLSDWERAAEFAYRSNNS